MVELSKYTTSWKIVLELKTGNVVISEVAAVIYVVVSKAKNHVLYGELVGTAKCVI
jgi:flagellar basal body P-ring protein FlgI